MISDNRILGLAVGLAGVIAAPAGHAAPTVYGQFNISVDQLDNGKDSALNVSSNSSRIGVKGDIQMGGDLAAIYQLETDVFADNATSPALASRNSFLGLQSNYGTVRLGRFDTPVKVIGRAVDLFPDQVGDTRNITRGVNNLPVSSTASTTLAPTNRDTTNTQARFDERPNNSIDFTTKDISGFKGTLLYSTNTDTGTTSTNDNDLISVAANYSQGPVYVGLGYERAGFLSTINTGAAPGTIKADGRDPSVIRLGGYYDINNSLQVTGLWQTVSGEAKNGSLDEDAYGIGVRFRNEDWTYKLQAYQLKADASNKDTTLLAAGVEYALQKGVTLYADYAATDNDSGRSITPYKEGRNKNLAAANGDSANAISLGAIVKF